MGLQPLRYAILFAQKKPNIAVSLLMAASMFFVSQYASAEKLPHYIFILPNGYTGWIQVIFDSPGAAPLVLEHGNAVLGIKNDGVIRLPIMGHIFAGAHDEFFYEQLANPAMGLQEIPGGYLLVQQIYARNTRSRSLVIQIPNGRIKSIYQVMTQHPGGSND